MVFRRFSDGIHCMISRILGKSWNIYSNPQLKFPKKSQYSPFSSRYNVVCFAHIFLAAENFDLQVRQTPEAPEAIATAADGTKMMT